MERTVQGGAINLVSALILTSELQKLTMSCKTSAKYFSGPDVRKISRRFASCLVASGMQMGFSMIRVSS